MDRSDREDHGDGSDAAAIGGDEHPSRRRSRAAPCLPASTKLPRLTLHAVQILMDDEPNAKGAI
jgi:hypothetical protein